MKILIITTDIGRTAPGIVFETLIKGLSETNHVDVITSNYDPSSQLENISKVTIQKNRTLHPRICRLFISILGFNPIDALWGFKARRKIDDRKYHLIFCFISYQHYFPLFLGRWLKAKFEIPFFVYSVDAIPAPIGWGNDRLYRKGVIKFMRRWCKNIDGFFSANDKMLDYQIKILDCQKEIIKKVIYVPCLTTQVSEYKYTENKNFVFLYTGKIYGARKIDYCLKAFQKILKQYPNALLQFVGTKINEEQLNFLSKKERESIVFDPYARDLTPYYKKAIALIDIDADIEDDVFMSSKIANYLTVNRLIISETGLNSPSRHLLKGIPSVIQCLHNENELYNAMEYAILSRNNIDFSDRNKIIGLFSIKNVTSEIDDILNEFNEFT